MAATTLADLLGVRTQVQYFQDLMARHKTNGVPISAWLSIVNVGLSLTQLVSEVCADLRARISFIAAGLFLETATGAALTLFARSQFQLERQPATFTIGTIRLTSVAGAPVWVFAPGDITVGTPGPSTAATRLFVNTTGGALQPGGSLDLTFQATSPNAPGVDYNIPTDSPLELKTAYAGVLASNPAVGLTGTWITTGGQEEEGDDRLKLRCAARWATTGSGGNEEALTFWALAPPAGYAASPVSEVRCLSNNFNGVIAGGAATVVVLGPAGPLAVPDLFAVAANFENPRKYSIGCQITVINGSLKTITLTGTVSVFRGRATIAEVQAQIAAALATYTRTLLMGQSVYPQRRVAGVLENAAPLAIRDVDLGGMAAVINQGAQEKPVFSTAGLVYQLVDV